MKIEYRKYIKYSTLGNLVVYEGGIGSGTTLAAVVQLVKTKPKNLLTNLHSLKLEKTIINQEWLLNQLETEGKDSKLYDCTIFIDMAEFWLDSRWHQTKVNKLFTYLFYQSRRRNIKWILTCKDIRHLDGRIRIPSSIIRPQIIHNEYGTPKLRLVRINPMTRKTSRYPAERCKKYFKYYETNEIIRPVDSEG